jgi:hypothetical protein
MVRHQKGNILRRGRSWFFRYCDNVVQPDGSIKRKVICKKLPVACADQYRTKASVKSFADEILAPINAGKTNVQSTMRIADFVEQIYFPEYADVELRPSTRKGYGDMWRVHIKQRLEKMTLRRIIIPALERCEFCEQPKSEHQTDDHLFVRDNAFPRWHGWHAFRRGIATNLHQLGVADKDIQAILRHSNIGITMNIYVKSVAESQVDAMDLLGEEFEKQQIGNPSQQKLQVN